MHRQLSALYQKGTMQNFIYRYYVSNLGHFRQYKDPINFASQYQFGEREWQQLQAFALKDSIDLSSVPAKDKAESLQRMEVLMARQIWRYDGYYQVSNLEDKAVKKALEIMQ